MTPLEGILIGVSASLLTLCIHLWTRLRSELQWWTNRRATDFSEFARARERERQELRAANARANHHRRKSRALRVKLRRALGEGGA